MPSSALRFKQASGASPRNPEGRRYRYKYWKPVPEEKIVLLEPWLATYIIQR